MISTRRRFFDSDPFGGIIVIFAAIRTDLSVANRFDAHLSFHPALKTGFKEDGGQASDPATASAGFQEKRVQSTGK
jgi:hypothetical protein